MMTSNIKTYWEKIAETRWGDYTTAIAKRIILLANGLSIKSNIALEIGCEGGGWSKLLMTYGWKMLCSDIDKHSLTICKKRLPEAICILTSQNSNSIHLKYESIGLLLCVEVHPVINSDWFPEEAFRVLQNEGLVVGTFWNLLSFRGLFHRLKSAMKDDYIWYNKIYPYWKEKFVKVGFTMLYEEGYCWFPFSRNSNSKLIPYMVKLEKCLGLRKLTAISPWIIFIAKKN